MCTSATGSVSNSSPIDSAAKGLKLDVTGTAEASLPPPALPEDSVAVVGGRGAGGNGGGLSRGLVGSPVIFAGPVLPAL